MRFFYEKLWVPFFGGGYTFFVVILKALTFLSPLKTLSQYYRIGALNFQET